jgi:hypothetical protein
LENAFAAFQDLGYVSNTAGKLQLAKGVPGEASAEHPGRCLEESIAKFLDREAPA